MKLLSAALAALVTWREWEIVRFLPHGVEYVERTMAREFQTEVEAHQFVRRFVMADKIDAKKFDFRIYRS